ncbi:hypothetical protein FPOAC2_05320 [Fusarium poae]|uniref:hypothetical protein n=1 Tax=Fusarium poae TaxID=36050 RepID=UPI001CE89B0C|nr:hypothetical protein FPOAC1_005215 [Fusarium poae]KAG8671956.1 hypothetical protein FPOAC1_005215 [Fusarium poae]
MLVLNSNTDMEIPGLDTEAYAASVDHLSSLEKFGRKWYAAGLTAGLAQAMNEAATNEAGARSAVEPTLKSDDSQDLVAALIIRNEELEKKVKEIEEKDKQIESFKTTAIAARERLVSAHAAMVSIIESAANVAPYWLAGRLTSVASEIDDRRKECSRRIERACQESKKRSSDSQETSGKCSKHRKHD